MNEIKNDLMKRKEVSISIESASNPGFVNATKEVAHKFKASEEQIVIRKIGSSFGKDKFVIDAYVYNSAKDKIELEPKKKVKKSKEAGK